MHTIALRSGALLAEILPQHGAGLARLDRADGVPVLRRYVDQGLAPRQNQLACFVLLPWSNRMDGGFSCDGKRYDIAPNREGDIFPIHGEAWQQAWTVASQTDSEAVLTLERSKGAPFNYQARITYALQGACLSVTLEVRNTGDCRLPYGVGLHPYIPRSAGVTLHAPARELWMPHPNRLPSHAVPVPEHWSFDQPRTPPDGIDHIFQGWGGHAQIAWPELEMDLSIDAGMGYYIVYTPPGADFFCFEPVDHMNNAHNLPGLPGLTMLDPGATLRRQVKFTLTERRSRAGGNPY